MLRDYCVCPVRDGLLYVEVPSYGHLRNLILNQRFRNEAHFRTVDGYVPYYGGALAFDAHSLYLAGVKPLWYLRSGGNYARAVEQLIADAIYYNEQEAEDYAGQNYGDECEWWGPRGLRFNSRWIEKIWIWPGRASRAELIERQNEIARLLPRVPIEFGKPEPPEDGRQPCRH